ncbi:MAG: glycosyltransferase [Gammaproteobacteria bacterium]|nr:glycosyltransferase [Gammaproteobacteria bacterium]
MNSASANKNIVIIANTMLFPARRNGASVRYYPMLKELLKRGYTIDLIIINKFYEQHSEDDLNNAQQLFRHIDIINISSKNKTLLKSIISKITNVTKLLSPIGTPYCLIDNNKQHYLHELTDILQHRDHYSYSIGAGIGGENAIFLSELAPAIKPDNIVCDLIDSVYLLRKRSLRPLFKKINPITLLEDSKTKQWEKNLSNKFTCLYISKEDARASNSDATIIPNCVVDDDYNIAKPVQLASPNIGFVGNMGYKPNIEACDFLCDEIFPVLLTKRPDTHLYVIGRNPSDLLLRRSQHPNIHITGEVDNVWSYIKSIDVFVFPIISGAGLQNKVLEAMYAGKPVVCSHIANEGIEATHGKDIYIAGTTNEYIEYIEKSLIADDSISSNARQFIDEHFSIHRSTDMLEQVLHTRLAR